MHHHNKLSTYQQATLLTLQAAAHGDQLAHAAPAGALHAALPGG
jgi:hypothetical protein